MKILFVLLLTTIVAFAQSSGGKNFQPRAGFTNSLAGAGGGGGGTVIEFALGDRIDGFSVPSGDTTYSFSAWVRPIADSAAPAGLLTDAAGASGIYYAGGAGGTHKINFLYSAMNHLNTTALTEGVWNHIVISVSAGTGTFYFNGSSDGTCSSVPAITFDRLGTDAYADDFKGRLAQVAVYDGALTAQDAADLYNKVKTPDQITTATDIAYWKLDDVANGVSGNGATFVDSSGNGETGTGTGTIGRTADF